MPYIKSIAASTFTDCKKLVNVTMPTETIDNLGYAMFSGCSSLKSITLPKVVLETFNPSSFFAECRALESVELPTNTTQIGFRMFDTCKALTNLDLTKT